MIYINHMSATKYEQFSAAYFVGLSQAIAARPQDYPWAKTEDDLIRVHAKMMGAVRGGTFNKDGDGFKRACKALGIKHTFKAIREFLEWHVD